MKLIDGHVDTLTKIVDNAQNLYQNNCAVDINRLKKFSSTVIFLAIWLNKERLKMPFSNTLKIIEYYYGQINTIKEIAHANNYSDILKNIKQNKISTLLTIEGGEVLEGNLDNLHILYNKGIREVTLTWKNKNELGYGSNTNSKNGLTPFGKNVIKEMDNLNMIIDVSHLNEAGFWDVYKYSKKSFIASHSNSKTMCNTHRNLSDNQLKAIKERCGLVGVTLHMPMLSLIQNNSAKEMFLKHFDYIINIIGEQSVCFGSDFDGTDKLGHDTLDILSAKTIKNWIDECYGKEISEKFFYDNYMQYLKNNLNNN